MTAAIASPDLGRDSEGRIIRLDVQHVYKTFRRGPRRSLKETVVDFAMRRHHETAADTLVALKDISFEVSEGESVALLGFNGSGKSTLLKLVSGVMLPDQGDVRVLGRVAGLIDVGAGFHPDLTGRENIYLNGAILGMTKEQIEQRFDTIVGFSEIPEFIDTPVKFYSSGMFLRLAFSVAVNTDCDVFLIDEILAVGDEPFQHKCINKIRQLKDQGRPLVIVSHDLGLVADLCDRGIVLEDGRLVEDGPVDACVGYLRSKE